jgi:hypothetical protein
VHHTRPVDEFAGIFRVSAPSPGDMGRLSAALALLRSDADVTKTLELARLKMTLEETTELAAALDLKSATLSKIDLRDCSMTNAQCLKLCEALGRCISLKELQLCGNLLQDDGATGVAQLLASSTTLEKLDLRYCRMNTSGTVAVCRAVGRSLTLMALNLSGNTIVDDTARELAGSIKMAISLKKLNLTDSGLQITGCKVLCSAAMEVNRLKELHFPFNTVTAEMARSFSDLLLASSSLTCLNLHSCEVDPEGVTALAESMLLREERETELAKELLLQGIKQDVQRFNLMGLDVSATMDQLRFQRRMEAEAAAMNKGSEDGSRPATSTQGDNSRPQTKGSRPQTRETRPETSGTSQSRPQASQSKPREDRTAQIKPGSWVTEVSVKGVPVDQFDGTLHQERPNPHLQPLTSAYLARRLLKEKEAIVDDTEAMTVFETEAKEKADKLLSAFMKVLHEHTRKTQDDYEAEGTTCSFAFIAESLEKTATREELAVFIAYCHKREVYCGRSFKPAVQDASKTTSRENVAWAAGIPGVVERIQAPDETFTELSIPRNYTLMAGMLERATITASRARDEANRAPLIDREPLLEVAKQRKIAVYKAEEAAEAERFSIRQCKDLASAIANTRCDQTLFLGESSIPNH